MKSGQTGVHQFYDERALAGIDKKLFSALDRSRDQLIVALILEHLARSGISSELATIASSTPWEKVRWLTDEELKRTKLDNVTVEAAARLVGYRNGVATAMVEFSRADAVYAAEFYCNTAKQMLLKVRISSHSEVEQDVVKSWALYDNLSLHNGIKLKKVRMNIVARPAGGSDVDIVFRFTGADAKSVAQVKEFQFEDGSSNGQARPRRNCPSTCLSISTDFMFYPGTAQKVLLIDRARPVLRGNGSFVLHISSTKHLI